MDVLPEAFRSTIVPPRIIGTESEITIDNVDPVTRRVTSIVEYIGAKAIALAGFWRCRSGTSNSLQFLDTGGNLHLEVGGKIEYAAPECLGPKEAAEHDFYGIEVVQRIVTASGKRYGSLFRSAGTFLPRDDADPEYGMTCGFHHNFMAPAYIAEDMELLSGVLGGHLATRVWSWAGTLRSEGFVPAQKMWGIGLPVGLGFGSNNNRTDNGKKPMASVLTGTSDVIADDRWLRVEDRSVDPSFSIEITELTLATTSLVLRLIEQVDRMGDAEQSGRDRLLDAVGLINHVAAGRKFAGDLTLEETAELRTGEQVTALAVQERLARLAIELSGKIRLPKDERRAARQWLEVVQALRESSPRAGEYTATAKRMVNFAPRHRHLLKRTPTNEVLNVHNAQASQRNLDWDRMLPEGMGMRVQREL